MCGACVLMCWRLVYKVPWTGSATLALTASKNNHGNNGAAQINIAPAFGNVALLGELGKVTVCSNECSQLCTF